MELLASLGRRCAFAGVSILLTLVLFFFLNQNLPGGFLYGLVGSENPHAESTVYSDDQLKALAVRYGFNLPWNRQLTQFLSQFFTGDWGISLRTGEPVGPALARSLSATRRLFLKTLLLSALSLGLYLAIGHLYRRLKIPFPPRIRALQFLIQGIPQFLIGIFLIRIVTSSDLFSGIPLANNEWLPAISLTLGLVSGLLILLYDFIAHARRSRYLVYGISKGGNLGPRLRLELARPFLVFFSTALAHFLQSFTLGTLAVEILFDVPGLGRLFYDSLVARDFPIASIILTLLTGWTILLYAIRDIFYRLFDPRKTLR